MAGSSFRNTGNTIQIGSIQSITEPEIDRLIIKISHSCQTLSTGMQGLSQGLETGCLKFAVVKFLGDQILKGDHNSVLARI